MNRNPFIDGGKPYTANPAIDGREKHHAWYVSDRNGFNVLDKVENTPTGCPFVDKNTAQELAQKWNKE